MVYPVSFAQETGHRHRLDGDAMWVAVEHVRARIGVSTGFCRVRSNALRLVRAGSGRSPRERPEPAKTEPGPTESPQGGTRSGGKSADGHDSSGSIASVDVRSRARFGTWATARRVPGTAGWPDGLELPRKDMTRGRSVGKVPLHKPVVFPVARIFRGARSALIPASAGDGRRKDCSVSLSRLSPARNSKRRPGENRGSSEPWGLTGWVYGTVADFRLRSLRGGIERVKANDAGKAKRAGRRIGQGCVPRAE